jgi:hypothetical protein
MPDIAVEILDDLGSLRHAALRTELALPTHFLPAASAYDRLRRVSHDPEAIPGSD